MLRIFRFIYLLVVIFILCMGKRTFGQGNYKILPLPSAINTINQEFSGMAWHNNRLYLLPQYGDHKETKLKGSFYIYSIRADSISRVIDGKDTSLTAFTTISVENLNLLPDSVQLFYQGFEAITIVNNQIFLSIETNDTSKYCFLLKGVLNTAKNKITIDPMHLITLEKYPRIKNAGFESLTWLPIEEKLMAVYEFNALAGGGRGYFIDSSFAHAPQKISTPYTPFRITDIAAKGSRLYAINFYWNGDYDSYLKGQVSATAIKKLAPDLKVPLNRDSYYLQKQTTFYARIFSMRGYRSKKWKQLRAFDGVQSNWEGLVLFRKGALVITDANRNKKQVTRLSYLEF